MDYTALRTEILTDPVTLGYSGKTDQAMADLLNSVTTGRTLARQSITQLEFANVIGNADFPATAILQEKFRFLYSQATLNPNNPQMVAIVQAVFPSNTATWTRLLALATPVVSRAVELGLGPVVALDVTRARTGSW